jgi:hypothetical protein
MDENKYLIDVLEDQKLADSSSEMNELRAHREGVESILRAEFSDSDLSIRYGGSKAKGTMIKESYDLDMLCYFGSEDTTAGDTLKDIYNNVAGALEKDYSVDCKASALRLRSKIRETFNVDFHVDVVPGRYTDKNKGDCYLYISAGEKMRLKTNPQVHLDHVIGSGVRPAIKLMKLWKVRNGMSVRNFILELLVIDILADSKEKPLSEQLVMIWEKFRDKYDSLAVVDPANLEGNDLSSLLDQARYELASVADRTLSIIDGSGWGSVFGDPASKSNNIEVLRSAAAGVSASTKPWARW